MEKKTIYLIIEPYVHINITKDGILLYNTLNSLSIEIENDSVLFATLKNLNDDFFVLEISRFLLKSKQFKLFVRKMYSGFFGYLLRESRKNKPNQIMPKLMIDLDEPIEQARDNNSLLEYPLENLFFISLYLNNKSKEIANSVYTEYKQFNCPISRCETDNIQELKYDTLNKLFKMIVKSSILKIDIYGGNFFEYYKYYNLIELLKQKSIKYDFHIYADDLLFSIENDKDIYNKIQAIIALNYSVNIYIRHNEVNAVKDVLINIKKSDVDDNSIRYIFIIEDDKQFDKVEHIIGELNIRKFKLQPFYNGFNLSFIKDNVFLTKDEILNTKNKQIDILKNTKINLNEFGKLRILPNEDVHSNLNLPSLGKLKNNDIPYFVNKEMLHGNSWFKSRNRVKPCNNCNLSGLCPPVSNLEYTLSKNNLCYKYSSL